MMYLLKAGAALLVLICSVCVSGEYKRFTEKKTALFEGFVSLISFIKAELSCRGRAVSEWACEFQNDPLYDVGFISDLRESGNLHTAFIAIKDKLGGFPAEAMKLLEGYFAAFGRSYRSDEEVEACRAFDALSRMLAEEKRLSFKNVKVVRTLSYAIGVGVIILLL